MHTNDKFEAKMVFHKDTKSVIFNDKGFVVY